GPRAAARPRYRERCWPGARASRDAAPAQDRGDDRFGGELRLVSRFHVLEADLHGVADDRNVARSEAVCLLELALQPAPGQLQLGAEASPAGIVGQLERDLA